MHPRTQELLQNLDTYHADLLDAVESVPPALRERAPAPDRWSVAGVLEHLAIVERSIADRLSGSLAAARDAGLSLEDDMSSVLERMDIRMVLDRTRPRTASPASHPRSGMAASDALAELERAHDAVRILIRACDGLAIGSIKSPHPALGALDMYQWLLFVGAHEGRHAEQIREIGETLSSGDGAPPGSVPVPSRSRPSSD